MEILPTVPSPWTALDAAAAGLETVFPPASRLEGIRLKPLGRPRNNRPIRVDTFTRPGASAKLGALVEPETGCCAFAGGFVQLNASIITIVVEISRLVFMICHSVHLKRTRPPITPAAG
jgi:hypothetical protein